MRIAVKQLTENQSKRPFDKARAFRKVATSDIEVYFIVNEHSDGSVSYNYDSNYDVPAKIFARTGNPPLKTKFKYLVQHEFHSDRIEDFIEVKGFHVSSVPYGMLSCDEESVMKGIIPKDSFYYEKDNKIVTNTLLCQQIVVSKGKTIPFFATNRISNWEAIREAGEKLKKAARVKSEPAEPVSQRSEDDTEYRSLKDWSLTDKQIQDNAKLNEALSKLPKFEPISQENMVWHKAAEQHRLDNLQKKLEVEIDDNNKLIEKRKNTGQNDYYESLTQKNTRRKLEEINRRKNELFLSTGGNFIVPFQDVVAPKADEITEETSKHVMQLLENLANSRMGVYRGEDSELDVHKDTLGIVYTEVFTNGKSFEQVYDKYKAPTVPTLKKEYSPAINAPEVNIPGIEPKTLPEELYKGEMREILIKDMYPTRQNTSDIVLDVNNKLSEMTPAAVREEREEWFVPAVKTYQLPVKLDEKEKSYDESYLLAGPKPIEPEKKKSIFTRIKDFFKSNK